MNVSTRGPIETTVSQKKLKLFSFFLKKISKKQNFRYTYIENKKFSLREGGDYNQSVKSDG